jgi:hypothetical protein
MYIGVPLMVNVTYIVNLREPAPQARQIEGILRDKAEWMPPKVYKMSQKIRVMGGWSRLAHGPAQPPGVVFNQR